MVSGCDFGGADRIAEYEKPVDGLDGERSSLAYIQLEKHNERLKEALIRYFFLP